MTLQDGRKVIAFDFDGVLHDYHGWNGGKLNGPMPGMPTLVAFLIESGAHVVIHTTRTADDIAPWLEQHGFPPLDVYNTKWQRIDVFVDDRALHFTPALVLGPDAVMNFARRLLDYQPHWRQPEDRPRSDAPAAPSPAAQGDARSPFDKIGADRLADEVAALVRRGVLRTRTPVTDALEDYRTPPFSPRSERLADLEDALRDAVAALCADCRTGVAFNANGEHGFDRHSRPCRAIKQRRALAPSSPETGAVTDGMAPPSGGLTDGRRADGE